MKYTKEDLIEWGDDSRVKDAIGKECYFADEPDVCLKRANENDFKHTFKLKSVVRDFFYPFYTDLGVAFDFIIIKKREENE